MKMNIEFWQSILYLDCIQYKKVFFGKSSANLQADIWQDWVGTEAG
jgi:hypothetical protein